MSGSTYLRKRGQSRWGLIIKVAVLVLIVAPMILTSYIAFRYALDVPRTDSWDVIPILLEKQEAGTLSFGDFWAQHNEQRMLFPRLIMFGLAQLTGWNLKVGIGLNLALVFLIWLVLWRMLVITTGEIELPGAGWLLVLFAWTTFSTVPWENLIWELSGTLFFLNTLAALFAVWSLARWPGQWKGTVLAALAALVSMYSLGNGVLVWIVGLAMLMAGSPRKSVQILFWAAAGVASTGAYLWGYAHPSQIPDILLVLREPMDFLRYVFTLIGSPWHHSLRIVGSLGIIGVAAFSASTFWAFKQKRPITLRLLPWLAIGWLIILNALLIGLSRFAFGVRHAFAPRYITLTNLFWVSLAVVIVFLVWHYIEAFRDDRRTVRKLYAAGAFFLLLVTVGWADAYDDGIIILRQESREVQKHNMCVLSGCFYEECGYVLNITEEKFHERVALLRRLHAGPFRKVIARGGLDIKPAPSGTRPGAIETIVKERYGQGKSPLLRIKGWVQGEIGRSRPASIALFAEEVFLTIVPLNAVTAAAAPEGPKPDSMTIPWKVCISPDLLPEPTSRISAFTIFEDGRSAIRLESKPSVSPQGQE